MNTPLVSDFEAESKRSSRPVWPLPGIPAPEAEAVVHYSAVNCERDSAQANRSGISRVDFGALCRRPITRLLVLKLDHYGDFIIGMPALRGIREAFPSAEIRLVCGTWNKRNAELSGLVDEVRCFDFFPERPSHSGIAEPVPIEPFDAAVAGAWDIAIDLRVDEDTRHLLNRINARLRCGIGSTAQFAMLDIALPYEHAMQAVNGSDGRFVFLPPNRFSSRLSYKNPLHQHGPLVAGEVIHGLSTELPTGRLRAEIGLTLRGHIPGIFSASIVCEICRDGDHPVARHVFGRKDVLRLRYNPVVFEFDNPSPGLHYNFRVAVQGRPTAGTLQFSGVTVCQLEAAPSARFVPSELHIGEKLSLLVSLVRDRTRTLYTASESEGPGHSGPLRIAIAPFSNSMIRNWPASYYATLIALLLERFHCEVLLLGTPSQRKEARAITHAVHSSQLRDMVGQTTWDQLEHVLRDSDLVICNNSGTAHQAAALGIRVLAIYSGSHKPREWGPRGPRSLAITRAVPCSPCGFESLAQCTEGHTCMRQITPEYVLAEVESALADEIASRQARKRPKEEVDPLSALDDSADTAE